MESVSHRLRIGCYDPSFAKPVPPPKPILVMRVGGDDLRAEDYRFHARALEEWEGKMLEHCGIFAIYRAQKERLINQFWNDLEAENGMTGHPKSAMLRETVVLYAEPGDAQELVLCYSNLAKLVL
jgi:hypothetical protein